MMLDSAALGTTRGPLSLRRGDHRDTDDIVALGDDEPAGTAGGGGPPPDHIEPGEAPVLLFHHDRDRPAQ